MKGENSYINDNLDNTASFEVRAEGNYSHSTETRAAVPGTSFHTECLHICDRPREKGPFVARERFCVIHTYVLPRMR